MSRFGVTITDLNDFLSPSQACIVAESAPPPSATPAAAVVALHPVERRRAGIIRAVGGGGPVSLSTASDALSGGGAAVPPPVTARVSLSDCLACSGCVTSAETVLMEQQSAGELRRLLQGCSVVVLLSPQALAALALYLGMPDLVAAYARLAWFFKRHLGCAAVLDTQVGLDLVLAEAGDEALRRLGAGAASSQQQPWLPPRSSLPVSATQQRATPASPLEAHPHAYRPAPLPVLSSACPGWVCYAEKSAPEALPYVSTARSPQQATGALVKTLITAWQAGSSSSSQRVATVSIMPCYEKKLEASRKDFESEGGTKDVDCVLVAAEVVDLLVEEGFVEGKGLGVEALAPGALCSPAQPVAGPAADAGPWQRLEDLLRGITPSLALVGASSTHAESDGLCAYAYRHVQRVLVSRGGGLVHPAAPLPAVAGRNSDFKELTLEVSAGDLEWLQGVLASQGPEAVRSLWRAAAPQEGAAGAAQAPAAGAARVSLTFFLAYGFRNIQGILARLKKRASLPPAAAAASLPPVFVEIMACPKGCTNGGGLPKGGEGGAARVAEVLQGPSLQVGEAGQSSAHDPHATRERLWALEPALGEEWLRLLHTQYHNIPPLTGEAAGLVAAQKW